MQTITIAVNDDSALKAIRRLEEKRVISIVEEQNVDAPSLPGKKLKVSEFRQWIEQSELAPAISFEAAKSIWAGKRKKLRNIR